MAHRDGAVRASVERIFRIWEERGIYDTEFVDELISILSAYDIVCVDYTATILSVLGYFYLLFETVMSMNASLDLIKAT